MSNPDPNADATLKTLELDPGELVPHFWGARNRFAVHLGHSQTQIRITPTAAAPGAVIKVGNTVVASGETSQPLNLDTGLNRVQIEVTAADGETRQSYLLKVIRAAHSLDWEQLVETAPFAPRDSAGELVFDNAMWIVGGYLPEVVGDVWRSADGVNWEQVGNVPDDAGVNVPVNFVYHGRMWISSNTGKFYSSTDGATWELVNEHPLWAGRYGVGSAVFADRMWALAGSGGGLHNDVWSSTDGVTWNLETDHAPWSPRQPFGTVTVHRDRLWVVGGGITSYEPFRAYRDVWSSANGRDWELATDQAPWPARVWSCCETYRDRMWLLGGFRAQPTWNNFNDIWYSADGATWQQLETEHVWEPRHELSAYVFNDALWVVAGNMWPLKNDVWRLRIPGFTFTSTPIIEDYAGALYTYHAHADFHADTASLRYSIVEGPEWLTVDTRTGVVRGTPVAKGDCRVVLEARTDAGEIAQQSYTLHITQL